MIRIGFISVMAATTLALAGCSGDDGDGKTSSGGSTSGSSSGGSSSGSSSGNSSSGGSSSGGSSSGSTSGNVSPTEPEKKDIGGQCKASADCKSDFCVFTSGPIGMCTQTCDDDIDCPGLGYKCARLSDAPQKVCVPE